MERFTSRKFLLSLGAFLTLVANGQYTEAVAVVVAFLAVQGAADYKAEL